MLMAVVRMVWNDSWVEVTMDEDVVKGGWMSLEKKQASQGLGIGNRSQSAPQCSVVCSIV